MNWKHRIHLIDKIAEMYKESYGGDLLNPEFDIITKDKEFIDKIIDLKLK